MALQNDKGSSSLLVQMDSETQKRLLQSRLEAYNAVVKMLPLIEESGL